MGVVSMSLVCLVGVVVRRYIDFLILLIPTPLVSALFCISIPTFCSFFFNAFLSLYNRDHRLLICKVYVRFVVACGINHC